MQLKKNDKTDRRFYQMDSGEIMEPLSVIDHFFEVAWLPEHLGIVKQWRNDISFGIQKKSEPSILLHQRKIIVELLTAAWLLRKEKIGRLDIHGKKNKPIASLYIKAERKKFRHYPKHLGVSEILSPHKVIRKTFKLTKLKDFIIILDKWLKDALDKSFCEESLTKLEVIYVYERLTALFEASWLISQRPRRYENKQT